MRWRVCRYNTHKERDGEEERKKLSFLQPQSILCEFCAHYLSIHRNSLIAPGASFSRAVLPVV